MNFSSKTRYIFLNVSPVCVVVFFQNCDKIETKNITKKQFEENLKMKQEVERQLKEGGEKIDKGSVINDIY